jgi:acyl carrier protein
LSESAVRTYVREHLAGVLGIAPEEVQLDCGLDRYGLDSVEAVLMAGAIEDDLGLRIDPAAFLQCSTIESMVVVLEGIAAPSPGAASNDRASTP